jgi:uncharacterized protein YxjI
MKLIFRDNFFSVGTTDIMDEDSKPVGYLDLKSAFGSSLDVYDSKGVLLCGGRFLPLSNKWEITGPDGNELGLLRSRMAFFEKKFEYDAESRGSYEILSPAFSKEYTVLDSMEREIARFDRISGYFSSGAYVLESFTDRLGQAELICMVMGVHSIWKRQQNSG